jgi:putative methyltransferase (TIGR04325 family)
MKLKQFIPPILLELRHYSRQLQEYENFEMAQADSLTYEDSGVVEIVSRKTQSFIKSLTSDYVVNNRQIIQNMFVLQYVSAKRKPIDVLELGGACGASYFELNHLLPCHIKNWLIVETPAMVAVGKKIFENDKIKFFDDLQSAVNQLENQDLLVAQGVLQVIPEPLQSFETLLKLGFPFVYVSRQTVGEDIEQPIITKWLSDLSAHGPSTKIPEGFQNRKTSQAFTIVPAQELIRIISENGYKIQFFFDETEDFKLIIGKKSITSKTIGFLLTREMP